MRPTGGYWIGRKTRRRAAAAQPVGSGACAGEYRTGPSPGRCPVIVLVADDDPGSLLVARAAVEHSGHDCLTARDGDEAWAMYLEYQPDVVVTDWMMPGLDGLALCRAIRAR